MRKNSKQHKVVATLLEWYAHHGRAFPWRGITDPYKILVSEIMLQQTHVRRVLMKYPRFLRRFPTLRSLARARRRDIVIAWQGMGYNNRAVRLHQLARNIVGKHSGKLPADFDALMALPGIGRYTANAILSSAFEQNVPVVDVNVRRVLSRVFWQMSSTVGTRTESEIWNLATDLVPEDNAYHWNQALMDVGATVCTARRPQCACCPLVRLCSSRPIMTRRTHRRPRREPSLDGIPHRIYRGRVVEELRRLHEGQTTHGTRGIRTDVLGKRIYEKFSDRHVAWLRRILEGLERDGLIRIRGNDSQSNQWVSLA
jgi:A/G-specific adenine glycosylase